MYISQRSQSMSNLSSSLKTDFPNGEGCVGSVWSMLMEFFGCKSIVIFYMVLSEPVWIYVIEIVAKSPAISTCNNAGGPAIDSSRYIGQTIYQIFWIHPHGLRHR